MSLSDKFSSALNVFLVGLLIYNVFFKNTHREKNTELGVTAQNLITIPGKLLNSTGQLNETGWSKSYIKEFNPSEIYPAIFGLQFSKLWKYKKFDMYSFFFEGKLFQICYSNVFYGGSIFVLYFDYETKTYVSLDQQFLPIIDRGNYPNITDNIFTCEENTFTIAKDKTEITASNVLTNGICMTSLNVKFGDRLSANLVNMRNTTQDDLYEILPISENNRYFYYNFKGSNHQCGGNIKLDGVEQKIDSKNCMGTIDYGRGVFEYKTNWIFTIASGLSSEGKKLSLNFGGGIASSKTQTVEDSFKLNDKLYKLNPVVVSFDDRNLMNGARMKTASAFEQLKENYCDVVFQAYYTTEKSDNFLVVLTSFRYVYGVLSGSVSDDNGVVTNFENIPGWFEIAKMRW